MPKVENVARKEFPEDALERLQVVDEQCRDMTPEERQAAFVWLKSKFRADWPSDAY